MQQAARQGDMTAGRRRRFGRRTLLWFCAGLTVGCGAVGAAGRSHAGRPAKVKSAYGPDRVFSHPPAV